MSGLDISEIDYTKFNLSYPTEMTDPTPAADVNDGDEATIPSALIGILVPHIVCTLVVLARTYSRLGLLRKWFLDDTLILLAWALATAVCTLYTISTQSTNTTTPITPQTLGTYTALILHQLTLLTTKLSILTFYHRIFSSSPSSPRENHHHHQPPPTTTSIEKTPTALKKKQPLKKTLTLLTLLLLLLAAIPLLTLAILQCHPSPGPGRFFNRPAAQCFTLRPLLISSASLHAAVDVWLVALIVPCVVRLREVSVRQRVVLGGVLSLGVLGVVVGVVRGVVALGLIEGGGDGAGGGGGGVFAVLTVLELDVAVVCASAPTLRPVLARVWPWLGVGELGGRGGRGGGEGSVDLTSVVSYHGYPWTRNATPVGTPRVGSKNGSVLDVGVLAGGVAVPPVPPPLPPPALAMAMHRAPTTLSLRSFMSSVAPKSRGRMEGEDRTGLLGEGNQADGLAARRRSSVGLEAFYEQFSGHNDLEKRRSRCGTRGEPRLSRGSRCYSAGWGDSQESFVLGVNDPQSPKRLSPVSGLSEVAKAKLRRHGREDGSV